MKMESSVEHKLVHLDLKGAPPKISYFQQIFPLFQQWGATGLLIEYEDMFPYNSHLQVITSPDAYSEENIKTILQLAADNSLMVIPLVQTFGHFEFVLKHSEFCGLREIEDYPMSLCPSKYESISTVQKMIDQVMTLHPNIKYFHMGCDEVYHLGLCTDCKKVLTDEKLVTEQLFFSHVSCVGSYIKQKYPGIQPIIWDDMFRYTDLTILKECGIGDIVQPMVWHYLPSFVLPPDLFDKLSKVFPDIWFASAYKGATGSSMLVTNITYHIDNHLSWLKAIKCERSKFNKIHGMALTGWQRYDHYAILCELLPHSLPCLALCLQIMQKGEFNQEIHLQVSKQLKFPSLLPLVPFQSNLESECKFPGSDVYTGVIKVLHISAETDAFLNSTGLFTWMNEYHIKRNNTNPNHIQPMVNEATRLHDGLNPVKYKLYKDLSEVFYKSTVEEWLGVHLIPRLEKLQHIIDSGTKQLECFKLKSSKCEPME